MFYVQAFCFLIFQLTENMFVLLLKTKVFFARQLFNHRAPPKGLTLGRACTPAQSGSTGTAPHAAPRNAQGGRAAPEHREAPGKGPSTQLTQAASPGSTRAPRDASPGQNPTSSEVSLPTAPTQHNVVP